MNNLICIVGPTATGKTRLAEEIKNRLESQCDSETVKQCNSKVELISIDSRQVYIGMDIGTGKDAKIFGTDLVRPDKLFNVSDFAKIIKPKIEELWKNNTLPILVGGTGLYLKSIIDEIETIDVPPDEELRKELEKMTVNELQDRLLSFNHDNLLVIPAKAGIYKNRKMDSNWSLPRMKLRGQNDNIRNSIGMNNSDWNNPRRLIRKIEIEENYRNVGAGLRLARAPQMWSGGSSDPPLRINKILMIGLTAPISQIAKNIEKRVKERLDKGLLKEIKELVEVYGWNEILRNTIAYKEWENYFSEKSTLDEAVTKWTKDEIDYAKRQMTWFRKDDRVIWIEKDYLESSLKIINSSHLFD